jgi:uncharacterized membrane protein YvlD (DUF360 family)
MLNTFFFGYLSLKWRRLFRTLIMIPYCIWTLMYFGLVINAYVEGIVLTEHKEIYAWFYSIIGIPIIIGLLSWLIQPFVVKENS